MSYPSHRLKASATLQILTSTHYESSTNKQKAAWEAS